MKRNFHKEYRAMTPTQRGEPLVHIRGGVASWRKVYGMLSSKEDTGLIRKKLRDLGFGV